MMGIPPQAQPTIAEALTRYGVSWKWYSGGRNGTGLIPREYCGVCDPLTFSSAIMTGPLKSNLQDHAALFDDIDNTDRMPAVAFVKPDSFLDGHPATSKLGLFEALLEHILERLMARPELFAETALLVLFDEQCRISVRELCHGRRGPRFDSLAGGSHPVADVAVIELDGPHASAERSR